MSGLQRRDQLIEVSRRMFAERGFDATSIEEIASAANISKPVVYEHFGDPRQLAPMYAHMLMGMVALTGEWWAQERSPGKEVVVTQTVNMAWNGVSHLEREPHPVTRGGG